MTCFWDGIIQSLTLKDFQKFGLKSKPKAKQLVKFLKKKNVETPLIKWNNEILIPKTLKENKTRIKDLDINSIKHGYDCSSCEPFLLLVSKLFIVNYLVKQM